MKALFVMLAAALSVAAQQKPKIAVECFKVHSMTRADSEHYFATWTNACRSTIDSVYVMVDFLDNSRQSLGTGVWALHFVSPGASRTIRFTVPSEAVDFHSVKLRKITRRWEDGLVSPTRVVFAPDRPTGDPGPSLVHRASAAQE